MSDRNTKRVHTSLNITSKSLRKISETTSNLSQGLVKSIRVTRGIVQKTKSHNEYKRTLIGRDDTFFRRRREAVLRKDREDIIEAGKVGGPMRMQGKIPTSSTRGFLGRVLNLFGVVLIGWMVRTLPELIKKTNKFIKTIKDAATTLSNWIESVGSNITAFTNDFGEILSGVLRLEFTKENETIETEMEDINKKFALIDQDLSLSMAMYMNPKMYGLNSFDPDEIMESNMGVKPGKNQWWDFLDLFPNPPSNPTDGEIEEEGEVDPDEDGTLINSADEETEDKVNVEVDKVKELDPKQLIEDSDDEKLQQAKKESGLDKTPDIRGLDGKELSPEINAQQEKALDASGWKMFKKGGFIKGKSHEQGGEKALVESGEGILNKETTEKIGGEDTINALNSKSFWNIKRNDNIESTINNKSNEEQFARRDLKVQNKINTKKKVDLQLAERVKVDRKGPVIMVSSQPSSGSSSASPSGGSKTKVVMLGNNKPGNFIKQVQSLQYAYT